MKIQKVLLAVSVVAALVFFNALRVWFVYETETGRGIVATAWQFSAFHYGVVLFAGFALVLYGAIGAIKIWRRPFENRIKIQDELGYAALLFGKAFLAWGALGMTTARSMGLL